MIESYENLKKKGCSNIFEAAPGVSRGRETRDCKVALASRQFRWAAAGDGKADGRGLR